MRGQLVATIPAGPLDKQPKPSVSLKSPSTRLQTRVHGCLCTSTDRTLISSTCSSPGNGHHPSIRCLICPAGIPGLSFHGYSHLTDEKNQNRGGKSLPPKEHTARKWQSQPPSLDRQATAPASRTVLKLLPPQPRMQMLQVAALLMPTLPARSAHFPEDPRFPPGPLLTPHPKSPA